MNLYALIRWLNYAGMSLCQFFKVAQFARNPILFIPISGLSDKRLRVAQFDRNGGSLWSGICTTKPVFGRYDGNWALDTITNRKITNKLMRAFFISNNIWLLELKIASDYNEIINSLLNCIFIYLTVELGTHYLNISISTL